jgi:hypothetical protein
MRRCECTEADRQLHKTQNLQFANSLSGLKPTSDDAPKLYYTELDIWAQLVATYTSLSLSFESDRLPALSGLAQRMVEVKKSAYLAGLWRRDLPCRLLWFAYDAERASEGYEYIYRLVGRRSSSYLAPTWSWASIESPICFERTDHRSKLGVEIIHAECTPAGADPFGHCASGFVTVSGRLVGVRLCYNMAKTSYYLDSCFWLAQDSMWFYFWPDYDLSQQGQEGFIPSNSEVFYLLVSDTWDALLGLVLRHLDESDKYERIGMFRRKETRDALMIRWRYLPGTEQKEEYIGFNSWFGDVELKTITIV